jgi:two-component system response regulator
MPVFTEEVEILLAEDSDTDAELCIEALRRSNLANRLVRVKDGAEVLEFLFANGRYAQRRAGTPRLIMLDLGLPKISGLDVLRKIKSEEATRVVPVVIMTSSTEQRDMVDSYKLGANSYVSKPVEFDEFSSVVTGLGLYWLLVNRVPTL